MSSGLPHKIVSRVVRFALGPLWKLIFAYVLVLGVSAFLGRWTPEFLQGRDLWHFYISRMVVPMVMLAALSCFIRVVPAAILLAAIFLTIGTISAIKREATGEPFQVSDLFLAGQSMHLLGYVGIDKWLMGVPLLPALLYAAGSLRFRMWNLPVFAVCAALLSTYRFEPVVNFIHDYLATWGVENLTFSQAESERMNGIGTHLYFSTAGLMLHDFAPAEISAALAALGPAPAPVSGTGALPDIYIVLGEAWWHDPSDPQSPIARLSASGLAEGSAISPVYGGTTPNAEFEVLTGIPVKSFRAGIIPYQHYVDYISEQSRALPRLLTERGYEARAFHNFTRRFWLRDKVYPRLGFQDFDGMEQMQVEMQPNGWPADAGLYADVLSHVSDGGPQFKFVVTVETHGPFAEDAANDMQDGANHPGIADYRTRLSRATTALAAFDVALRAKGRPYILLAFGDHLPGLREHQSKIGMVQDSDPRLHQVSFLVSGNTGQVQQLRDRLDGKPLYCFGPSIADTLRLGLTDRYFAYAAQQCQAPAPVVIEVAAPVIHNQIFAPQPM